MQKIEPANFEDLFERRLERYNTDRALVAEESQEQEHLSSRLQEANANFLKARSGDSSTKEREQALQKLETAYFKYKEIISNLDVGRKFYNDLAKIVNRFRDECKSFVYQRRLEAGQIEADLTNAMSSLNISQTNALQHQKQQENHQPPYDTRAPTAKPLTAPLPTRAAVALPPAANPGMWTPEMGIKFGGPAQANNVQQPQPQPGPKARGGQWDPSRGLQFG